MPNTPIHWDEAEKRLYEYGVSKGVLFVMNDEGAYGPGEAWNGLINISDNPEGADVTKLWADGIQYAGIRGAEEYHGSVEAYMYPPSFAECDGSAQPIPGMYVGQQNRKKFGLCWRTEIGNANTDTYGYKLHIAYGLAASPSEKSHDTVNDSPDAQTFSWDTEGTPVPMQNLKPTAKLEFDSTKLGGAKMTALENILYGSTETASRLPLPDDILSALQAVNTENN